MNTRILIGIGAIAALTLGCGNQDQVDPAATTKTSTREIPGTHAANDLDPITAQRFVDRVRVGHRFDADGGVAADATSDDFTRKDAIHVAMEVTDAPAGSTIQLLVLDASTKKQVWTEAKSVEAGKSHLQFSIDAGELPRGKYSARVVIGDETVARRSFSVIDDAA